MSEIIKVKFTGNIVTGKVSFVKPLRSATGIGLKPACDIADDIIRKGVATAEFSSWHPSISDLIDMKNSGVVVTVIDEEAIAKDNMKKKIKDLITEAIDLQQWDVAEKLLAALKGI